MRTAILDLTEVFGDVLMSLSNIGYIAFDAFLNYTVHIELQITTSLARRLANSVDGGSHMEVRHGNGWSAGLIDRGEAFKLMENNVCCGTEANKGGVKFFLLIGQFATVPTLIDEKLKAGEAGLDSLERGVNKPGCLDSSLPDRFPFFDLLGFVYPERTQNRDLCTQRSPYHGHISGFLR